MEQRNWSNKILKGEELLYYTLKLRTKLKEMEEKAESDLANVKAELEGEISDLSAVVDANKQETDAAIEGLQESIDDVDAKASEALEGVDQLVTVVEDLANDMVQLIPVAAVDYDEEGKIAHIYSDAAKMNEITPAKNKVYLVPTEKSGDQNIYDEYIWTPANGFELIGSVKADELEITDVENIWNEFFN